MKKIFAALLIAVFATSMSASAQKKGDLSLGGGIAVGTLIPTMSIGATVQYNIIDQIRLAGNVDYFIKNRGVNTLDITVDGHYLVPLSDRFTIYPVVGVGISILMTDFGTRVPFVANIGGGVQYKFNDKLRLSFEIKGRLGSGVCQAVIGPNLIYTF